MSGLDFKYKESQVIQFNQFVSLIFSVEPSPSTHTHTCELLEVSSMTYFTFFKYKRRWSVSFYSYIPSWYVQYDVTFLITHFTWFLPLSCFIYFTESGYHNYCPFLLNRICTGVPLEQYDPTPISTQKEMWRRSWQRWKTKAFSGICWK